MSENVNKENNDKKASITVKEPSNISHQVMPDEAYKRSKSDVPLGQPSGLRIGSLLRVWTEVSKINYFSTQPLLSVISNGQSIRRRSIGLLSKDYSIECFVPSQLRNKSIEDLFAEQFPINVTPLLNEDQLWGCFYIFPELYSDVFSPVVSIRDVEDVHEVVAGELTRDMVTPCLTYLKRSPIMRDYVYIKLDLSSKLLMNIDILQHYKYLVYLDLSSNLLTQLNVLSYLLYLQYLSVAFNRLSTVLEYDTPQWFLTEVHYKFNSVKRIRDLSAFWSITILDLSHNNIKGISGLESLRYLRRLDLSFNHIQRLENLNHLRLLWLDVSYNNISSFEFGPQAGLWTLLHLEYLNLNENNLTSMKMFSGCIRLRELHARNNRLSMLLELAVYMRQMRRLIILDLRANPMCSSLGYKNVVINTFPILLSLDAEELDPVEQQTAKMEMKPDVNIFASRRLLRLLYVEQLSRARVSPHIPPADTTEVPIVVLVGYEGVGKGALARRLAAECSSHIELALQHTTAPYHTPGHYKDITREKFDDMVLAGEFLTYTEKDSESYGLSREEAFIKDGKVRVVSMDLVSALMLKLRGRRPYMILCTSSDPRKLIKTQQIRKLVRNTANEQRHSLVAPMERSTLQVMLSGRIIITGILNEILLCLPEEKEKSEFVIESECSLMMDSEARQAMQEYARGVNLLTLLTASATSLEDVCKRAQEKSSQLDPSLYSLYKESQGTGEYNSYANGQNSLLERKPKKFSSEIPQAQKTIKEKPSSLCRPKSVDFSRYASSTWKGLSMVPDSSKSSKSVTFTGTEAENTDMDPTGLLIEPPNQNVEKDVDDKGNAIRSISTRMPWPSHGQSRLGSGASLDDIDLWLAFLTETGVMQASDLTSQLSTDQMARYNTVNTKDDDPDMIIHEMGFYQKTLCETISTTIRDEYDGIHRLCPGLFWDTVLTDDHEAAFLKLKKIIRDIVNSQELLTPMFDIDFHNLKDYPTVQNRLDNIRQQIAPQTLFH